MQDQPTSNPATSEYYRFAARFHLLGIDPAATNAEVQRAYEIATAQLRAGTINVLTVLNTETVLFSAENTLVQVKLARLDASVSLFKALGGGWNETGAPNA